MDPITPGVISGLVTNALGGAAGPLWVLEPVFVARRTVGFWDVEITEALTSSGLSGPRRKVLAAWAGRRTNFTLV